MKFFYDEMTESEEKICEKTFVRRTVSMACVIVACLIAMSLTAYAYYSAGIASGQNFIQAAIFEIDVEILATDENGEEVQIEAFTRNNKVYRVAEFEPFKTYTVTVSPPDTNTSKTGFVIITADDCNQVFYTGQLGADEKSATGKTPYITFTLTVTDKTVVTFTAHWGTSTYYDSEMAEGVHDELYVGSGDAIKMIINGIEEKVDHTKTETKVEETGPEEEKKDESGEEEKKDPDAKDPTKEEGSEPADTKKEESTEEKNPEKKDETGKTEGTGETEKTPSAEPESTTPAVGDPSSGSDAPAGGDTPAETPTETPPAETPATSEGTEAPLSEA